MKREDETCSKCGHTDWYQLGKYERCKPCHNQAQKAYRERKRLGQEYEPKKPSEKSLSKSISPKKNALADANRAKQACPNGHEYSKENTLRSTQAKKGTINRKCRKCDQIRKKLKYGTHRTRTDITKIILDLDFD